MFTNRWHWTPEFTETAVDVWVVEKQAWEKQFNGSLPMHGDVPALVVGSSQRPLVVVPPKKTARRTKAAFGEAVRVARGLSPSKIGVLVDGLDAAFLRAALWGVGQGLYQYKPEPAAVEGPEVLVVSHAPLEVELTILREQMRVRDWINIPSNLKPPTHLADYFQEGSSERIQWQMFNHEALKDMGAGGILAVGQGSHRPPVLLTGRYEGKPGAPWIALVGKGITFDSGGISLKPGEGMGRMKGDMGGAAAVAGAIRAVAQMGWPVNVLAVLPLAENLPGGGAYRPGDVLTMMDGTHVEVISTDAEGRLVLADGVTWARRQGAQAVVDMATLTGANVVALGGIRSGLITNDDKLANQVKAAADWAAEPTWELPHDEDYGDLIKTSAADIKNSGGRPAGTVTAGLFIGHFAGSTPWAHLDIAGLSFSGEGGQIGAGATGYGVATLVEVCRLWAQED
ncbi:leucyl aminopeptidase family protein [Sulfobacillus harzensis]|uniref:Probable cytosol aminopeptidase n=1 Tax=Sulfobacillus harzensis TaxID=2729629 RepID=A0A7Y0L2G8_9FIRM|nr:leucyl aminopeptidase family protein [Sulfobacillus harzensis]NMP22071.1 leucyl aminopeptidase family protein [Sulfobacillus harzensis]